METGVYNAAGGITGKPSKCVIVVSPLGDAASDADVNAMMAHETWHCYEGAVIGLARYWSQNPAPWIMEGEADWIGATLFPDAPTNQGSWPDYIEKPGAMLFTRAYSALGFYAQLATAGIDPWGKLVPILEATSNAAAFVSAGADADPFLDSWASSYLRDPTRGAPWEIAGPAAPGDTVRATPTVIQLSNGGSAHESAAPYTNLIAVLGSSPDVMTATFSGHTRVSDGAGHDYLVGGSAAFCLLNTGCVLFRGFRGASAAAAQGRSRGAGGHGRDGGCRRKPSAGISFADFCSPMTGTWVGTWRNDNGQAHGDLTATFVQKGTTFSGTGEVTGNTCVRHATTGTINGVNITFGLASATQASDVHRGPEQVIDVGHLGGGRLRHRAGHADWDMGVDETEVGRRSTPGGRATDSGPCGLGPRTRAGPGRRAATHPWTPAGFGFRRRAGTAMGG